MKKVFTEAVRLLAVLLLITPPLASCSNDDNEPAVPVITPQAERVGFTCGTYAKRLPLAMTDVTEWNADVAYTGSETGWVTVVKEASAVLLTVEQNTGAARKATLRISAPGMADITIPVEQKAKFSSELIGKYVPHIADPNNPIGDFFITPTYTGEEPQVDISFLFGPGAEWPITTVTGLAGQIVGMLYSGGLSHFEFKNDGTIGAAYRELLGFDMSDGPTFGEEVVFPNAETLAVLPVDAITYYTENGKVYFAIDKEYLASVGRTMLDMELIPMIDLLLSQYPDLGIVSTKEYYALALKYAVADGVLTVKVDREMMMPFIPLIEMLVDLKLPDGDIEVSLDPSDPQTEPMKIPAKKLVLSLIDGLFNKSATIEIGIGLTKK